MFVHTRYCSYMAEHVKRWIEHIQYIKYVGLMCIICEREQSSFSWLSKLIVKVSKFINHLDMLEMFFRNKVHSAIQKS